MQLSRSQISTIRVSLIARLQQCKAMAEAFPEDVVTDTQKEGWRKSWLLAAKEAETVYWWIFNREEIN